jgi:hypothetical protein
VGRSAAQAAVMTAEPELPILDVEIVETEPIDLDKLLDPQPLQYPPAVVAAAPRCICGNATDRGHGGFTCDEVLAIGARVTFGRLSRWKRLRARRRGQTPDGWRR